MLLQDAQPVARTEPSPGEILKPSLTAVDVKPSLSGGSQDVLVPQIVDVPAAAELVSAAVAATDNVNRADSPHSLSGDLTGFVFDTCTLRVLHQSICQSTGLFVWQLKSWIETFIRLEL